jgi:hypothetical protein
MSTRGPETRPVSGWAVGFAAFAGAIMLMIGIFHVFAGLAALFNDNFFTRNSNYTYDINITGWGWIHLILGIIIAAAGLGIFSGATWARVVGIILALLSAVANFFYIPVYPVWAILIIALDVVVIWALASIGGEETTDMV